MGKAALRLKLITCHALRTLLAAVLDNGLQVLDLHFR